MRRFFTVFSHPSGVFDTQFRLLLFVVLPLLVITALGIRLGFDQASRYQQKLLKTDLEMIARAVRIPVGEALARDDLEGVHLALQSIFTIDRVYGASVFDQEGKRVASGGIAESDLTGSWIPLLLEVTGEKQESYRKVGGRLVFSTFLPLFNSSGQSEGFIQITRRPGDLAGPLRQMSWIAWLVWGALALTISLTVVGGYRRGIGRHVDELVAVMAEVGAGHRSRRAAADGPREVAAIAEGLNAMLDNIEIYEREIDRRRESEQTLRGRLKDQEKMAALGDMARGFAHELGAPLSVIDGRARRLQRRQLVKEGGEFELAEIRRQANHLSETVTHLLELSRGSGFAPRALDLRDLVGRVAAMYSASSEHRGVTLESDPADELPGLTGEPARLQVAISCLVRNGLQAAESRVSLGLRHEGENLRVDVEDDGPGLPDVEIDRLTEPFFTTKASGEGTGLGLAIANKVANDHGGVLELINIEGGGCRASLVLPLRRSQP